MRGDSCRWIDRKSARRNRSSSADVFDADFLAPLRRQVLAPGDDVHAERLADRGDAGAEPAEAEERRASCLRGRARWSSARGRRPSAGRSRSRCGASVRASGRWRCAAVALPNAGVPQTTTPCALAASRSIEALRIPVVIRSFRSGSASITARGKAVRSRMAQTMAKPCSAAMTLSWRAEMFVEHLDLHVALDLRPVGKSQRDVLIIVENCAAQRHEYRLLGRARRRLITAFGRQASDEQQTAGNALGPRLGGGVLCCGGRQGAGRLACHFGPGPRI